MKRDSIYNPASTDLPEGWSEVAERKKVLEKSKSAIVIKINNPVYSRDGYQVSDEECDDILHRKVTLIVYDIPTRYYQTSEYLWIFEECLEIESNKEVCESFRIPIQLENVDECIDTTQTLESVKTPICQSIRMLKNAYDLFLKCLENMFHTQLTRTGTLTENLALCSYASNMDKFIKESNALIDENDDGAASYVLQHIICDDITPVFIKPEYINGVFVQWLYRFRIVTNIIESQLYKYEKLHDMYISIDAFEIYDDNISDMLSELLDTVLTKPWHNQFEEITMRNDIVKILTEGIHSLECHFWPTYCN